MAQQNTGKKHTVTLDNRERLTATGVDRVDFLSGELITAHTSIGRMNIKGDGLFVENLNAETGELLVRGRVLAMSYTDGVAPTGFFKRLLK
ncbi:MAG: YabP/YqfC family sporulation protein [Clostridia bacterium]|nr:YabP/YqfC family sporulation protein [Clostridia bacterium]